MRRSEGPLDERAFHRWVAQSLRGPGIGLLPVGDDTAAIPLDRDRVALFTSDALVEGVHFTDRSPAAAVGLAAAAVSLSDLAAKGGRPVALLIDLLLPRETPVRWAQAVVAGADRCARAYGARVVGGDTKPSRQRAVVGAMLGIGRRRALAPRSGARPGDQLVVTGAVGRGGVAARALGRRRPPSRAELASLLMVRPRVAEGQRLVEHAHAMLDSSDGLADSALLLAAASRCRVVVETERIPWHPALGSLSPPERIRTGFYGGDYELVAALPPKSLRPARRRLAALGCPLTVVGRVERGAGAWREGPEGAEPMPPAGWRPFDRRR